MSGGKSAGGHPPSAQFLLQMHNKKIFDLENVVQGHGNSICNDAIRLQISKSVKDNTFCTCFIISEILAFQNVLPEKLRSRSWNTTIEMNHSMANINLYKS